MNAARRAERRTRHGPMVDLPLVSLIDIFTILIFFLLANATEIDRLPAAATVRLPESTAQQPPRETLVVSVGAGEIQLQGSKVADTAAVAADAAPLVAPLAAALARHAPAAGGTAAAVTIVADRELPYRLLRKVMASAAHAGFAEVSFAVRRKEGA